MGPKVGRKRSHHGIRDVKRASRTRARTRDLDNVFEDMAPEKYHQLVTQEFNPDIAGNAQFYCVECSRYFVNRESLAEHCRTKAHKKRVKTLQKDTPYTQKEAELAAGLKTDNGKPKILL
jgi:bud site selection protein 20